MVALAANPLVNPEAWDVVVIAGEATPGVAKVSQVPRRYKIDVKDVAGAQGQTTTYQGWQATADIQVRVEMWTAAQIDDLYARIIPLVAIDATKATPSQVDVYHPLLQAQGVTSVLTKEIGELRQEAAQLWTVTMTFCEYRPAKAKNVTSTPKGDAKSGSASKEQANPDVNQRLRSAVEQELALARRPL